MSLSRYLAELRQEIERLDIRRKHLANKYKYIAYLIGHDYKPEDS